MFDFLQCMFITFFFVGRVPIQWLRCFGRARDLSSRMSKDRSIFPRHSCFFKRQFIFQAPKLSQGDVLAYFWMSQGPSPWHWPFMTLETWPGMMPFAWFTTTALATHPCPSVLDLICWGCCASLGCPAAWEPADSDRPTNHMEETIGWTWKIRLKDPQPEHRCVFNRCEPRDKYDMLSWNEQHQQSMVWNWMFFVSRLFPFLKSCIELQARISGLSMGSPMPIHINITVVFSRGRSQQQKNQHHSRHVT